MEKNRKTVLIADDDVDLLQLVQMQLQHAGFRVLLSVNGFGITKLAESRPDIILLDITMDGISGGDICLKLKANALTSSIPIIMFSANDNIEQIVHECGANDFVRKPFNAEVIREKIARNLPA
jgi:DNA-binding response OmpR family regulator